jgi:hypothetical protein
MIPSTTAGKWISVVLVILGVQWLGSIFSVVKDALTLTPKALSAIRWLDAAKASEVERTVASRVIQSAWRAHRRSVKAAKVLWASRSDTRSSAAQSAEQPSPTTCYGVLSSGESSLKKLSLLAKQSRRQAVLKGLEWRDPYLDRLEQLERQMETMLAAVNAISAHLKIQSAPLSAHSA